MRLNWLGGKNSGSDKKPGRFEESLQLGIDRAGRGNPGVLSGERGENRGSYGAQPGGSGTNYRPPPDVFFPQ